MTRVVALVRRGSGIRCAVNLGETTAIALVRSDGEGPLRAARAAGAVREVALWDKALLETDYLGFAQVLASAARYIGFEVLVTGEGERGAIGPAVAERLGLPHLTGVIDARIEGTRVIAKRRAGGAIRSYSASIPVVLCATGSPPPMSDAAGGLLPGSVFGGGPLPRIQFAEVGVSTAELTWRGRFAPRPAKGPSERPLAFPDVTTLAARLAAEGLVPRRS
ncbi:MAG: hypothetical protein EXR72_24025 [Myxococcales bacterium]|nr:hypothetical protein [Myxococcales bacterium]